MKSLVSTEDKLAAIAARRTTRHETLSDRLHLYLGKFLNSEYAQSQFSYPDTEIF